MGNRCLASKKWWWNNFVRKNMLNSIHFSFWGDLEVFDFHGIHSETVFWQCQWPKKSNVGSTLFWRSGLEWSITRCMRIILLPLAVFQKRPPGFHGMSLYQTYQVFVAAADILEEKSVNLTWWTVGWFVPEKTALDFIDVGRMPWLSRDDVIWFFRGLSLRVGHFCSLEPESHSCFNSCFSWMTPSCYVKTGCFTKHPFKTGCVGYQYQVFEVVYFLHHNDRSWYRVDMTWRSKSLPCWVNLEPWNVKQNEPPRSYTP